MPTIHIGLSNGSHYTLDAESPETVWAKIQKGESLDVSPGTNQGQVRPPTKSLFNPGHVVIVNVLE